MIINESGEPDVDTEPKTYDIEIEHEGELYWKLGMTCQSLAKRFKANPPSVTITIRQIWRHRTEAQAVRHEQSLFRKYKGDMPFIGKMGPLLRGGNTEVFSHDVVRGEPPPKTFDAFVFNDLGWRDKYKCYVEYDPYSRWETQYGWVPCLLGPQFTAVAVREKSTVSRLVVCSVEHLENIIRGQRYTPSISKRVAERARDEGHYVHSYGETFGVLF